MGEHGFLSHSLLALDRGRAQPDGATRPAGSSTATEQCDLMAVDEAVGAAPAAETPRSTGMSTEICSRSTEIATEIAAEIAISPAEIAAEIEQISTQLHGFARAREEWAADARALAQLREHASAAAAHEQGAAREAIRVAQAKVDAHAAAQRAQQRVVARLASRIRELRA